jgi:hypothetical protein
LRNHFAIGSNPVASIFCKPFAEENINTNCERFYAAGADRGGIPGGRGQAAQPGRMNMHQVAECTVLTYLFPIPICFPFF